MVKEVKHDDKIGLKGVETSAVSCFIELTFGFVRGSTGVLEGGGSKLEYGCRTRVIV